MNVCSEEECELNTIEGAVNIPLNELRERLGELPKGRPVVVFCAVGLRGYIAARILMQRGYEVYNLSGGLKTYKAVTVRQSNEILPETLQKEQSRSGGGGRHLTVDACGLQCPGPVMKLKSGMEGLKIGERLEITATDPGFVRDVGSWAKMTGNRLVQVVQEKGIITATLEKGEGGQGGGKDGVSADGKTIVVFSDDLDRALASFVIADGAASAGRKVTLFFTFWGLNVIKRKATVPVKKDMAGKLFGMMLPSGSRKLALSKLNLGGIGSRMMRGMMKNKKIDSLETLMEQAKANGVEFIACRMSMEVMGIKAEELLDGVKIGGVATYLERAEQANINLFI